MRPSTLSTPLENMPGRDVVIYSAGADSTLILAKRGEEAKAKGTQTRPVLALVIDSHHQIERRQFQGQRLCQQVFLKWARKRGLPIEVTYLTIGAKGERQHPGATVVGLLPQAVVWLLAILPYIDTNDRVHFGYIRYDDFWHDKAGFEAAFKAVCAYKGVAATLHYDLEWESKEEVVAGLMRAEVPPACIWTCESPIIYRKRPGQCGRCPKCKALAAACARFTPAAAQLEARKAVERTTVTLGKGPTIRPMKVSWPKPIRLSARSLARVGRQIQATKASTP